MSEPAANAELMRSLGRLVRGLSALFWGLPVAFLVCYYTARAEPLRLFGVLPSLACTGLVMFGLWQIGDFQRQERVWRNALERARMLGLVNLGLSPFLYWWNRAPGYLFFLAMVILMTFSALLLLASLNVVLQRLGAMLPDEALRLETRHYTVVNLILLAVIFGLAVAYAAARLVPLDTAQQSRFWLAGLAAIRSPGVLWLLTLLVLIPLAMTMALVWKTKEVILESVFGAKL
jgi:hypothetical protein